MGSMWWTRSHVIMRRKGRLSMPCESLLLLLLWLMLLVMLVLVMMLHMLRGWGWRHSALIHLMLLSTSIHRLLPLRREGRGRGGLLVRMIYSQYTVNVLIYVCEAWTIPKQIQNNWKQQTCGS